MTNNDAAQVREAHTLSALNNTLQRLEEAEAALLAAQQERTRARSDRDNALDLLDSARKRAERAEATITRLRDVAYNAWTVIANVSEGDWDKQTPEWKTAAERWRDEDFHPNLPALAQDAEQETA